MYSIPAIEGGVPIRREDLRYGKQYIDDKDIKAVVDVLKGQYITCGPMVNTFEEKMCEMLDVKYCVAVANGTAALHIACMAAGVAKGDEVIVTPMTFAASSNCILYCGATPVFADINPETYNISPDSIRKCITEKTKAVIAVDFTGQAVELDEIRKICEENHLILIEDAAHAIGTRYKERAVGGISDITTFSFHPVKTITGGEGGAITTNNVDIYQSAIRLRSHGITRDKNIIKNEPHGKWYNEQVELGYNYRMTDFQAALLVSQLDKLYIFSERRSQIVEMYNNAFSDMPEIVLQKEIPESKTTRHLYIIQLDLEKLKVNRERIFDAFYAEHIFPQVHYMPVYYHSYYESLGYHKGICPNAEKLYETIMSIPLFYSMTDRDVADVIRATKRIIDYYRK